MVNVYNTSAQTLYWIDDRLTGGANPVRLVAVHIPSLKIYTVTPLPNDNIIDLTGWYNGNYECSIVDNVTEKLITSFTLKVIDINSLSLSENSYIPVIVKNDYAPTISENDRETELGYIHNPAPLVEAENFIFENSENFIFEDGNNFIFEN